MLGFARFFQFRISFSNHPKALASRRSASAFVTPLTVTAGCGSHGLSEPTLVSMAAQSAALPLGILLAGETFYNACRKLFSVGSAQVAAETGLSYADLGVVASSFSLSYAVSKPLFSLSTDFLPSRGLFAAGLAVAGLAHVLFARGTTLGVLCLCWGLNGFAQARRPPPNVWHRDGIVICRRSP